MINTDVFGYMKEENGKYAVTKNGEIFISGVYDAMEAAKIVELLRADGKEEKKE